MRYRSTHLSLLAALVIAANPLPALAHVKLTASVPAQGSEGPAPQAVDMTFSEPMQLTSFSLKSDRAAAVKVGSLPKAMSATARVAVPSLAPGRYIAKWRGVGKDGHVMNGQWQFSVAAAGAPKMTMPAGATASSSADEHAGHSDHDKHHEANKAAAPQSTQAANSLPLVDGEIRKVDTAQRKLTVRHGPLTNLNMGAMTMVFPVAAAAWSDQLKAGDKVRMAVDRVNGVMTIVALEPVVAKH